MSDITPEILERLRFHQQQKPNLKPLGAPVAVVVDSPCNDSPDAVFLKNDQGTLIQKVPMKEGTIHGIMEEFDDQGDLVCQISFEKGQKNGACVFFKKGRKISESTYARDVLEGPFATYHANGKANTTGTYTKGAMDQEFCIYDDQGGLVKKELYQLGSKEGLSQTFYPTGVLYEEVLFSKDLPINESKTYHTNQSLMMLKRYKDGMIIYQELYDDKGNLLEQKSTDSEKGL